MSAEEIEDIFLDLAQKFGFQRDSMRNMVSLPSVPFTAALLDRGALPVRFLDATSGLEGITYVTQPGPHHYSRRLHRRPTCQLPQVVFRRAAQP